jgi:hypothetical protein
MPPSEHTLDDLWPSDNGAIGTCPARSLDVRNYNCKPNPRIVYLGGMALHKYGIVSDHDCGLGLGLGTRIAIWNQRTAAIHSGEEVKNRPSKHGGELPNAHVNNNWAGPKRTPLNTSPAQISKRRILNVDDEIVATRLRKTPPRPYLFSVGMLAGSILGADRQAGASGFAHSVLNPRNRR